MATGILMAMQQLLGQTVSQAATAAPAVAAPVAQQAAQQPTPAQAALQFWLMLVLPSLVIFLVLFVRALPWSANALAANPLGCDACMSGWVSIALFFPMLWFFNAHWSWVLIHLAPAPGIAILTLALYRRALLTVETLTPPE